MGNMVLNTKKPRILIKNGVLMAKLTAPIIPELKTLDWFEEEIRKLKK